MNAKGTNHEGVERGAATRSLDFLGSAEESSALTRLKHKCDQACAFSSITHCREQGLEGGLEEDKRGPRKPLGCVQLCWPQWESRGGP